MRFSLVGFFIGALCALVLFAVGTALTSFVNEGLLWGLAALLLWGYLTFRGDGAFTVRR